MFVVFLTLIKRCLLLLQVKRTEYRATCLLTSSTALQIRSSSHLRTPLTRTCHSISMIDITIFLLILISENEKEEEESGKGVQKYATLLSRAETKADFPQTLAGSTRHRI
jgi:hypothetical protein